MAEKITASPRAVAELAELDNDPELLDLEKSVDEKADERFAVLKEDKILRDAFQERKRKQAEAENITETEKQPQGIRAGIDAHNAAIEVDRKSDQFAAKDAVVIAKNEREPVDERMKMINEEIERAQREFVDMKLKKETAFAKIDKFLDPMRKEGKKRYENGEDPEIAQMRQWYQNALDAKKNILIEDAREKGAKPEDLLKILLDFEDQRINGLAKTYDEVRTEHHEGKIPGKMGEKLVQFSKWYQKLPLSKKIGMAALFIGAGYAASHGLVAAGFCKVIVGTIATRRAAMSALAGTSAALWAEKKTKENREEDIQKRGAEFSKSMEGIEDEGERMNLLREKLQGMSQNVDADLDHMRYQNKRNLTLGISAGVASAIIPKFIFGLTGDAGHLVMEKLGFAHHAAVSHVAPIGVAKEAIAPAAPTHEALNGPHAPAQPDFRTIVPPSTDAHGHVHHDSFMNSLKGYLGQSGHVDAAHLDQMTAKTFRDAAQHYADTHDMSYDEAVKKLSLIQEGTTYDVTWDAKGVPHMRIDDVKFAGGAHYHVAEHIANSHNVHEAVAPAAPEPAIDHAPAPHNIPVTTAPHDVLAYTAGYDGPAADEFVQGAAHHAPAAAEAFAHGPMEVHELAVQHAAVLEHFKGEYGLKAPQLHRLFPRPGILDGTGGLKGDAHHLKEVMFGKHPSLELRHANIGHIVNSPVQQQAFIDKLPRQYNRDIFKAVLKISPPKPGHDLHRWIAGAAHDISNMSHGGHR